MNLEKLSQEHLVAQINRIEDVNYLKGFLDGLKEEHICEGQRRRYMIVTMNRIAYLELNGGGK